MNEMEKSKLKSLKEMLCELNDVLHQDLKDELAMGQPEFESAKSISQDIAAIESAIQVVSDALGDFPVMEAPKLRLKR